LRRDRGGGSESLATGRLRGCLGVLALQNGAHGVAGLRDIREVEPGAGLGCGVPRGGAAAVAAEVGAHLIRLVFVDGTGVRLSGYADGLKRIEDGSALDFQFTCQIVDSNFVHPSLLSSFPQAA
jgi:hypothetical protein